MTALAILLAVAAIVVLLILDDREKRPDGMPVLEEEMVEDFSDWASWEWPEDEPHWRWPS